MSAGLPDYGDLKADAPHYEVAFHAGFVKDFSDDLAVMVLPFIGTHLTVLGPMPSWMVIGRRISHCAIKGPELRACDYPALWCIYSVVNLDLSQFDCVVLPYVSFRNTVAIVRFNFEILQKALQIKAPAWRNWQTR